MESYITKGPLEITKGPIETNCNYLPPMDVSDWETQAIRDIAYLKGRIRSLEAAIKRLEDSLAAPQRLADSIREISLSIFPE